MSVDPNLYSPFPGLQLPKLKSYSKNSKALNVEEVDNLFHDLKLSKHAWRVVDNLEICRSYSPSDYLSGMEYVQYLAAAAEHCDHHPEIHFSYQQIEIRWHTHFVKGLHFNDLVMAKYSDELFAALSEGCST